jgi:chitinase
MAVYRQFIVMATIMMASIMASSERGLMKDTEYTVKGHNKNVVCYWGTWANYRPSGGKFTPEDVDASLCTHLIYSFAGLNAETNEIKPLDPWMDLEEGYGLQGFRKATDHKYAYPHLKVINEA